MISEFKGKRIRSLDFLRGLAIIGVIAVHTNQSFSVKISQLDWIFGCGRFGVQLFFYVSAISLCHAWIKRKDEHNKTLNFYVRRFFRIAPFFWTAIPIYLLIGFLTNGFVNYWSSEGIGFRQIFLTATFLHGFWPDSLNSIVPGGWSIACEIIFYALFPLIIKNIKYKRNFYFVFAFSIWIFNTFWFQSFLFNFLEKYYITSDPDSIKIFLNLNFITQAPIFILGCYLYFLLKVKPKIIEICLFLAWILFSGILNWIYEVPNTGFLIIYLIIGFFTYFSIKFNFRFKALEMIGRNSYLIYLIHFAVIWFLKKIIFIQFGLLDFFIGFIFTLIISYLLATFISKNFESRIQKYVTSILSNKNNIV